MGVSCRTSCVFLGNIMNSGTWNMPIYHRYVWGGGWHCGGTLWFSEYVTIKRSSLCFCLVALVVPRKWEQWMWNLMSSGQQCCLQEMWAGQLGKNMLLKGRVVLAEMEWVLFCFKVATGLYKHVLSCIFAFLGGRWGAVFMMVHGD